MSPASLKSLDLSASHPSPKSKASHFLLPSFFKPNAHRPMKLANSLEGKTLKVNPSASVKSLIKQLPSSPRQLASTVKVDPIQMSLFKKPIRAVK